ncbi:MAG: hypothetical protein LLG16_07515 [Euryarchaeota archaeon]|nr:hypothetical protein [Euryarchaeota archaeon]
MPADRQFAEPSFPTFDEMRVGSNTRALALVPHEDGGVAGCGGTPYAR